MTLAPPPLQPDPYHAVRVFLLDQPDIDAFTDSRVYAYKLPRPVTDGGLLRPIILIRPSGRSPSVGDRSRALIGRPRFDLWCYGATEAQAMQLLLLCHAYLKDLSRALATLTDGTALIHDVVVEGGPLSFDDPDSDAPVMIGVYSATVAEEYATV